MGLFDDIRKGLLAGAGRALSEWAIGSNEDVNFEDMQKSLANAGLAEPTAEKPKAMFYDPYNISDWGGWRQNPSYLTYDTLRYMSGVCTPIAAILQLRVHQLSQFARPQQDRYSKGYRVVLRDRRDAGKTMTPGEIKRAMEIERMLETTGFLMPSERPRDRDSFRTFLKKGVRDQLVYDQWCFEKLRDRMGRPSRFIGLPSESIRPSVLDYEHLDIADMRARTSYVQVYENTVIAEFNHDELAWCVMNPRSDLRTNGFGFSPIEQIVRLVTAWLFGFQYNQNFFTQGSAVKGLLNVKGTIPDKQMKAFRRQWYAMISGVENAWRTPILNSEDVQWISMHSTNREMEFSAWMDWLTKLICAVYGVDPIEINFQFGNTGQSSTMNAGSQEEKFVESKDKGLNPLVEHTTDVVNQHLVWELEEDFELVFGGLTGDQDKEREGRIKEGGAYRTVNEVRALEDLPALPKELGEVILSPVWLQWATAKQAEEQQAAMMAQGMPPGAAVPQPPGTPPGTPKLADDGDKLLHTPEPSTDEEEPDTLLSHKQGEDDDEPEELLAAAGDLELYAIERLQKSEAMLEALRSSAEVA